MSNKLQIGDLVGVNYDGEPGRIRCPVLEVIGFAGQDLLLRWFNGRECSPQSNVDETWVKLTATNHKYLPFYSDNCNCVVCVSPLEELAKCSE